MSVKQERTDLSAYPPPPPLVHHGMRPPHSSQLGHRPPPPQYQMPHGMIPSAMMPGMRPHHYPQMYPSRSPYMMQMHPGLMPRPPALQPPVLQSAASTPSPQAVSTQSSPTSPPNVPAEDLENRIDKSSVKGNFGWQTLDNVNIPCIFRGGEKYVSVRMVEQKLLSKYPSTYPNELRQRPPLLSQFITGAEARLLNEINIEHCECEYGQQPFTEKDLVVSWVDFTEFYRIVKKHFPNEPLAASKVSTPSSACTGGGWVQVNNTVVPYLKRQTPATTDILRLAPLPVIKYAANLLTDVNVPTMDPTEEECKLLSDMCKAAGLNFNFTTSTTLILLTMLPVFSSTKVVMKRLPDNDPFDSAEYMIEFEEEDIKYALKSNQQGARLPTMQNVSPTGANRIPMPSQPYMSQMDKVPPPNVTVQPHTSMANGHHQNSGLHHGKLMAGCSVSASSLQALEKIAGPAPKRRKTDGSPSPTTTMPRASPNYMQQRGNQLPPGYPGMPVPGQAGGPQMMLPPGMVPAGQQGMWPPMPTNSADYQQLAEMMNMQAAILSGQQGNSRGGMISGHQQGNPKGAMTHSPQQTAGHLSKNVQGTPSNTSSNQGTPTGQQNSPPSNSLSAANKQAKTANNLKILPVDFHGKKISCLVRAGGNDQYALIEAISRVYFPQCSLDEFIMAMVSVLQVPIYRLDREEEKAFITFYGLPTSSLKCNKVLKLKDLDQLMPQMKYMFKDKCGLPEQDPTKSVTSPVVPSQGINKTPNVEDTNNNANLTKNLPPKNPFSNNNNAARTAAPSKSGGHAKKLEDAVNRLRQSKLKELDTNVSDDTPPTVPQPPGLLPLNPFRPNANATATSASEHTSPPEQ